MAFAPLLISLLSSHQPPQDLPHHLSILAETWARSTIASNQISCSPRRSAFLTSDPSGPQALQGQKGTNQTTLTLLAPYEVKGRIYVRKKARVSPRNDDRTPQSVTKTAAPSPGAAIPSLPCTKGGEAALKPLAHDVLFFPHPGFSGELCLFLVKRAKIMTFLSARLAMGSLSRGWEVQLAPTNSAYLFSSSRP